MQRPTPLVVALGACLALQTAAIKPETVVLSGNQTIPLVVPKEGTTVMTEEFYQDQDSTNIVIMMPYLKDVATCRLSVKVLYMDLPPTEPCRDYVEVCELTEGWDHDLLCARSQKRKMLQNFCGSLKDMPVGVVNASGPDHDMTTQTCSSIKILFHTEQPAGDFRGFKFLIKAIAASEVVPMTYCGPNDQNPQCRDRRWGERWFGLAIPMAIVMVLLFFAIAVKVRKQLCHPMSLGSTYSVSASGSGARLHVTHRRERAVQAPPIPQRPVIRPGWICPHEHLNEHLSDSHDPALPPPEVEVGFTDAATLMLLPPPYSPPEDRPGTPYDPPTEGEPPPLYEDSLYHTLQSEKAVMVAPPPGSHTHYTVPRRPNPPAYHVLPPQVESCSPAGGGRGATPSTSGPAFCPSTLVVTSSGEITLMPAGGGAIPSTAHRGMLPTPPRTHSPSSVPAPTASSSSTAAPVAHQDSGT